MTRISFKWKYVIYRKLQLIFNAEKLNSNLELTLVTLPIAEIICVKNVGAIVVCVFLMKPYKNNILKIWKKSWETFGSYLLNSKANPAHFHSNWAGLAVLFIRKLPNGSDDFFHIFRILFLYGFIKNTQTTMPQHFWRILFLL